MGLLLKKNSDIKKADGKSDFWKNGKSGKRSEFKLQIISEAELKKNRNSAYTYIIP